MVYNQSTVLGLVRSQGSRFQAYHFSDGQKEHITETHRISAGTAMPEALNTPLHLL